MKLFLDTANIEEIKKANDLGVICGVTTNPTLISREKGSFKEIITEITKVIDGPISAEVVSLESEGMIKEARELVKISPNIVIKIPMIAEGLKAVKVLSKEGIKTNVTLIFSANQALLACLAGATYISPFINRNDLIGHDGGQMVAQCVQIVKQYGFSTEIIAAAIRNPLQALDAALSGADITTVPYDMLKQMMQHPLTDIGIEMFLEDWKKVVNI